MRSILRWAAVAVVMVGILFGISQYDWRGHELAQNASGERDQQRSSLSGRPGGTNGKSGEQRDMFGPARELRLTEEQRRVIKAQLVARREARVQAADFPVSVGTSVPPQVPVQDLPMEIADTLGGYHGSQYLIIRDQVVIVDESRRIVAVIANVG